MSKKGKKFKAVAQKVDREKKYSLVEACSLIGQLKTANFDESVDVAVRLGVDPRQSDQQVRGAVGLPHGLGKEVRVVVLAKGDNVQAALDAGALEAGSDEIIEKIQGGWLDFDKLVASPDMMGLVGKIGKILGPRGLMPNPKLGTVTPDVAKAVSDLKAGKAEFRVEKGGIIHASIGRISFAAEQIKDNIMTLVDALIRMKPSAAKGVYIRSMAISSTMGPGIKVDASEFLK